MNILILANYDVGLFCFRKELIEELLKNNTVFISLPYGELVEPLKSMGCVFVDTQFERRGINPIKDFVLMLRYYKLIKKQNPDLVITYTIKPNVYGGFACRLLKIPYAANITGLGTGATLVNNIRICAECLIGAGAVVIKNIDKNGTYVGVPARKIK